MIILLLIILLCITVLLLLTYSRVQKRKAEKYCMQYVVNTLCSLNPSAAEHHKLVLERHGLPFNVKYRLKRDADLDFYLPYLRRMSFEETMDFISLLFELAIVDGIIRKTGIIYTTFSTICRLVTQMDTPILIRLKACCILLTAFAH